MPSRSQRVLTTTPLPSPANQSYQLTTASVIREVQLTQRGTLAHELPVLCVLNTGFCVWAERGPPSRSYRAEPIWSRRHKGELTGGDVEVVKWVKACTLGFPHMRENTVGCVALREGATFAHSHALPDGCCYSDKLASKSHSGDVMH
jgi:hypothetical protein